MIKISMACLLALGVSLASADLSTAQAQYGHHHHGRVGYAPQVCYPAPVYRSSYGYRSGYPQYRSSYGSYYASPGLSLSYSSLYGSRGYRSSSLVPVPVPGFGLGGYGNLGYPGPRLPVSPLPRTQLRIGF